MKEKLANKLKKIYENPYLWTDSPSSKEIWLIISDYIISKYDKIFWKAYILGSFITCLTLIVIFLIIASW